MEISTEVPESYAKEWYEIQSKLMIKAADTILKSFTLGVDGSISKQWQK